MKNALTLTLGAALLAIGGGAFAQNGFANITVDEHGHGLLVTRFTPVGGFTLLSGLTSDPGPGGSASALTYDLGGPSSLVSGDVLVEEPGAQGAVEDIIRFNAFGSGANPNYPASLVFYSDQFGGADSLADSSPFPTGTYANIFHWSETGPEGNNAIFYTPTAGQPGFIAGFNTQYEFVSDGSVVPEPSSVAALGLGVLGMCGLALTARKRRQSAA